MVAAPLADGVPVLPGVWVCCVDTAPCVGGSSRDGGNWSVLERLGVAGPVALGVRAGAPLPTLPPGDVMPGVVDPEVNPPPEDDVPDEDCASAAVAVKLSANVATIAVFMDGQRCNHGIVPVGDMRSPRP